MVVGLGGCIGAIARFSLSGLMQARFPNYTASGTLLVNVLGCLCFGIIMVLIRHHNVNETTQAFLLTGILGSLTTFSTFSYETLEYVAEDNMRLAVLNTLGNLVLGFGAVLTGRWLTELMMN